jgi:hypothetical protein
MGASQSLCTSAHEEQQQLRAKLVHDRFQLEPADQSIHLHWLAPIEIL